MAGLSTASSVPGGGVVGRRSGAAAPDREGWEATALRILEYVAYPALAGCALLLLSLGVVTWLPALAATGHALQQWRAGRRARPFVGALAVFGHYWQRLWRHAVVSTTAMVLLVANPVFLAARPGVYAAALLALQVGLVLALVPYHLALAVTAARDPDGDTGRWGPAALLFAFASPWRGLALLAAVVAVPIVTAPLAFGPLLLGATLPLLLGLRLADRLGARAERPS
ncbi:hypothetical protein O7632_22190 [Solwaraspora sp. WMMD406]|uniref:hypothetical protein n=1 Tax=Solwaraspora sp. WMMD406 TaxID=3016095 RepID=UPI002416CB4C|nr:hypothetical protein [Solwaraspora sp. WMMD406]MDG4766788.1 hypothetical protein [Solwaraspora sp. WMMD406]